MTNDQWNELAPFAERASAADMKWLSHYATVVPADPRKAQELFLECRRAHAEAVVARRAYFAALDRIFWPTGGTGTPAAPGTAAH